MLCILGTNCGNVVRNSIIETMRKRKKAAVQKSYEEACRAYQKSRGLAKEARKDDRTEKRIKRRIQDQNTLKFSKTLMMPAEVRAMMDNDTAEKVDQEERKLNEEINMRV